MPTKFKIQQEPGFYLDRDKETMPEVAGIYVVYKCDYDSYTDTVEVKEILYIGESQNIRERLNSTPDHPSNHELYDDFVNEAGGAGHICYGLIPMSDYSEGDRKWIQEAMVFQQKPPINKRQEKDHYTHPAIELTMEGFPNSWKSTHFSLPVG